MSLGKMDNSKFSKVEVLSMKQKANGEKYYNGHKKHEVIILFIVFEQIACFTESKVSYFHKIKCNLQLCRFCGKQRSFYIKSKIIIFLCFILLPDTILLILQTAIEISETGGLQKFSY